MSLDVKLVKQLQKLDTPNNLKNNSSLLDKGVHAIVCVGMRGSGKTYLMSRFIPVALHESFFVYIIAKNLEQDCWHSLKEHYEKKKIPVYTSDTLSNDIMEELKAEKKPKLIICDDITQAESKIYKNNLVTLFQTGRHFFCNVVAITQNIIDLPQTLRQNGTAYFIFKIAVIPYSLRMALKSFINKETFDEAYKYIKINKHSCMYLQDSGANFVLTKDFKMIPMSEFTVAESDEEEYVMPKERKKILNNGGKIPRKGRAAPSVPIWQNALSESFK